MIKRTPQGTPIDRCARIAKYAAPSKIVTSNAFKSKCDRTEVWSSLGQVMLKGLELTEIYQRGPKTISLQAEISAEELAKLSSAGRICELLNKIAINTVARNAVRIFVWEKRCIAIDYIIAGKYGVTIDIYLDKLPYSIYVFGRDNLAQSSTKEVFEHYFYETMCKSSNFLPFPLNTYKRNNENRFIFAEFPEFNTGLIAHDLIDICNRVENYIRIASPQHAQYFHIHNKVSGKLITVDESKPKNGEVIHLRAFKGGASQIWEMRYAKDNLCYIVSKQNGKCLEQGDRMKNN